MINEFIDTPEKAALASSHFRTLQEHPGWKLWFEIAKDQCSVLTKFILEGVPGETQDQIDRRRDALRLIEEMMNVPNKMIEKLERAPASPSNDDPYYSIKDLPSNSNDMPA